MEGTHGAKRSGEEAVYAAGPCPCHLKTGRQYNEEAAGRPGPPQNQSSRRAEAFLLLTAASKYPPRRWPVKARAWRRHKASR